MLTHVVPIFRTGGGDNDRSPPSSPASIDALLTSPRPTPPRVNLFDAAAHCVASSPRPLARLAWTLSLHSPGEISLSVVLAGAPDRLRGLDAGPVAGLTSTFVEGIVRSPIRLSEAIDALGAFASDFLRE